MGNKKIKWIIKEIENLKNENVINDETSANLKEYYFKKSELIKKESGVFFIKVLKFSLILLASLSIIGGVILLLVNFNWKLITKEMKTIAAFLMIIIPQTACGYILLKKKDSVILKEIVSLVLSILFGISVAFIGQIYQLSSDTEMFLIVWALSTLFIIYLFNSISSLALYLILLNALSSVMQLNGKVGLVFYPLIILIIPFYIIEYRADNKVRMKFIDYFLIISVVSTLGISLEKNVPGLWIIAYSLLFCILYLFGILFEEKDNNNIYFLNIKNMLFNPFKIIGVIGTSVMAFILLFDWPWEDIGWFNFRSLSKFNPVASYFDYSICIIFLLLSVFLIIFAFYKKKKFNCILPFFGIFVSAFYFVNASSWFSYWIKITEEITITNILILIFIAGVSIYSYYTVYNTKSKLILSLIVFYLSISFFTLFLIKSIKYYYDLYYYLILFICYFSSIIYMNGLLIYDKYDKDKNKLSVFYKGIGVVLTSIFVFIAGNNFFWEYFNNEHQEKVINIIFILTGFILIPSGILFYLKVIKEKLNYNFSLLLFPAVVHFNYIILTLLSYLKIKNNFELFIYPAFIILIYMLFLAVYSFYYGYKNKSAFTIFISSIFLFAVILSKFFNWNNNIVTNGFILIFIGIILVVINFLFIKKIKKDEKNEK